MVQDVASSIGRTVMGFLSVGALMSGVNSLVNKVMQIKTRRRSRVNPRRGFSAWITLQADGDQC